MILLQVLQNVKTSKILCLIFIGIDFAIRNIDCAEKNEK